MRTIISEVSDIPDAIAKCGWVPTLLISRNNNATMTLGITAAFFPRCWKRCDHSRFMDMIRNADAIIACVDADKQLVTLARINGLRIYNYV